MEDFYRLIVFVLIQKTLLPTLIGVLGVKYLTRSYIKKPQKIC
jgi:hypothetical protein